MTRHHPGHPPPATHTHIGIERGAGPGAEGAPGAGAGGGWRWRWALGAEPLSADERTCPMPVARGSSSSTLVSRQHLGAKPAVPPGSWVLGLWSLIGCWLCHCNGLIFDYRLHREARTLCPVGRTALSPWRVCPQRYWVQCYRSSREAPHRCERAFVQYHRSASYKKPRMRCLTTRVLSSKLRPPAL
jgi:hypothetical protein